MNFMRTRPSSNSYQVLKSTIKNRVLTYYIKDMVQRGVVKLQYVARDEHIADVFKKPLARVKFEYFREKLRSVIHSDMVRGLVPSMVRCKG